MEASASKRPSDEEKNNSPKKTKALNLIEEETHFYRLFENMLNILKERKNVLEENISSAIASIKQSFHWDLGNRFTDNDFNRSDILCGYLYRYGPHGAGLVRTRIMDAISNSQYLNDKLKKSELNILSLGGGPGNDIVGFCSALYEFNCRSKLNIIATDSTQSFSSCINLLEFLIREEDYGNVSKLFGMCRVNMSFMKLVLPNYIDIQCSKALREADILVMSKLFSILDENTRKDLIENLYQNMKPDAVLLYIDSPFDPELWEDFNIMYLSESENYAISFTNYRFGHNDRVSSKAQIAVLRKKDIRS